MTTLATSMASRASVTAKRTAPFFTNGRPSSTS
jgi:hypothetical protein